MKRLCKILSGLLLIEVIFLLVVFVAYLFVYNISNNAVSSKRDNREYIHKSLQVNTVTNESSNGFVQLTNELEDDEFISYSQKDSGSVYTLITNFGSPQYECTGVCYCSRERRTVLGSVQVRKGIYTLVGSVSVVAAINAASNIFRDECLDELDGLCPKESIRSDTEDCTIINFESSSSSTKKSTNSKEIGEGYDEKMVYECYGKCVPSTTQLSDVLVEEYDMDLETVLDDNSELSRVSERVVVGMTSVCNKLGGRLIVTASSMETAIAKFLENLKGLCEESTEIEKFDSLKKLMVDLVGKLFRDIRRMKSFCTSPNLETVMKNLVERKVSFNSPVWCVRKSLRVLNTEIKT